MKKNLGKLLQEIEEEEYLTGRKIKTTVTYNSKLSEYTKNKLAEVIKLCRTTKGVNCK